MLIKILIWTIAAGCFYVILHVNLGIFWAVMDLEKGDEINTILVNLAYSYLAGLIFYLLTTVLPQQARRRRVRKVLQERIYVIYGRLEDSKKAVLDVNEYMDVNNKYLQDNEFVNKIQSVALNSSKPNPLWSGTIADYMRTQKDEIIKETELLMLNQEYLTDGELAAILSLRNSNYFDLLKIVKIYINTDHNVELGKSLVEALKDFKTIVPKDKLLG